MKTLRLLILPLALTVAGTALADPPGPRPGGEQRAKHGHERRSRLLREKLGLPEAKARRVEAILEKYAPERRKAMASLHAARADLRKLLDGKSEDQAAYAAALDQLRKGRTALVGVMDRAFEELKKELSPKEQAGLFLALDDLRHGKGHRAGRGYRGKGEGHGDYPDDDDD